jgi:PhnB protein
MSQLDTYIFFDGNCAEAMRFYEKVLSGKLEVLMTHAESPMAAQAAPEMANRIMHARLDLDGRKLMASDTMVGHPNGGARGFSLSVSYPTEGEAKKIFDALSEGGRVTMPMQSTFWAKAFGMTVDKFGIGWMVNGVPEPM